jgi:CBS domain containing-hemolysin-like protein
VETALGLAGASALLAANAFFVLTEFSITRVRPTQLDRLEQEGARGVRAARHAVDHIDAYLAACQLGITVASLGLGVLGERAFHDLLAPLVGGSELAGVAIAGGLAFVLITVMHVVLGELSPKSVAIARTERSVLWVGRPMRGFYLATRPLVDLFNAMGNLLLRPFGIPPARESGHAPHSEDELRTLVGESEREGLLDPREREFTDRVFSFADHRVEEVMVPRAEVTAVDESAELEEVAARIVSSGHTRLPIVDGRGKANAHYHATDVLAAMQEGGSLAGLARPAVQIEASMALDDALELLQRKHEQQAIVTRDGSWVGVLSVEDLVEQIVGEIEDEFD